MKPVLYFSFSMLCCCLIAQAQAQDIFTLEKSLEGQFSIQSTQYDEQDVFVDQLPFINMTTPPCDMGFLYSTTCSGNKLTITLISPEYEVTKREYTFELPSGYELQTSYPTNKLTSDKSLMFINSYRQGSLTSCGLYNAKGKLVQSFAKDEYYAYATPFMYKINGAYKLLVWKGSLSGSTMQYTTDVYTFKNQATQIQSLQDSPLRPTPVRADNTISIPYARNIAKAPLLVVDSHGRIVESQPLNACEGTALVHVGTYRPGVYMYKIGEQTGKFVVN